MNMNVRARLHTSVGPPLPRSAYEARTPNSRHPVGQSEFPQRLDSQQRRGPKIAFNWCCVLRARQGFPGPSPTLSVCSDTTGVAPVRTSDVTRRPWAGPDWLGPPVPQVLTSHRRGAPGPPGWLAIPDARTPCGHVHSTSQRQHRALTLETATTRTCAYAHIRWPPLLCSACEAHTPSGRHPVGQSEFPPEALLPAAQGA